MNPYDPDGLPAWRPRRSPGHADPDFDLEEDDGGRHGVNGVLAMTVLGQGRLWKRRAIKGVMSSGARQVTWLVGELDGVRCYAVPLDGRSHVVLTTDDLAP